MTSETCITVQQYQASARCGFRIGGVNTEECNLLFAIMGIKEKENKCYVRYAKLPPVEEFVNRNRPCELKKNKAFCTTSTMKWIWEAYCYKKDENWPGAASVIAPMYISHSFGGDGIVIIRQAAKSSNLCKMRVYKDIDWPETGALNRYDMFEKNQRSQRYHTWGAQGTLMPFASASDNWKSLVDESGLGILCFYDEFWYSAFWFFQGDNSKPGPKQTETVSSFDFEVRFRPRQISNIDLLEKMILRRTCNKPCDLPPAKAYWPSCESVTCASDVALDFIPIDNNEIKDSDVYAINGETFTGAELKKNPQQRSTYKIPCIPVCSSSSQVIISNNEGAFMDPKYVTCYRNRCYDNSFDNLRYFWGMLKDEYLPWPEQNYYTFIKPEGDNYWPCKDAEELLRDPSDIDQNLPFTVLNFFYEPFNSNWEKNRKTWTRVIEKCWTEPTKPFYGVYIKFGNFPNDVSSGRYFYAHSGNVNKIGGRCAFQPAYCSNKGCFQINVSQIRLTWLTKFYNLYHIQTPSSTNDGQNESTSEKETSARANTHPYASSPTFEQPDPQHERKKPEEEEDPPATPTMDTSQ